MSTERFAVADDAPSPVPMSQVMIMSHHGTAISAAIGSNDKAAAASALYWGCLEVPGRPSQRHRGHAHVASGSLKVQACIACIAHMPLSCFRAMEGPLGCTEMEGPLGCTDVPPVCCMLYAVGAPMSGLCPAGCTYVLHAMISECRIMYAVHNREPRLFA